MPSIASKPRLIPVAVPWQVSPSTAFLGGMFSEARPNDRIVGQFVAYYKLYHHASTGSNGNQLQVIHNPDQFIPAIENVNVPYRLVQVVFNNGNWLRVLPAVSDREVIEESFYDWSAVSGAYRAGEDIEEFLQRVERQWLETGLCPNPGMYTVENSSWICDLGLEYRKPLLRHFLVVGNEVYMEVLAESWSWIEGQPLND